MSMSRIHCSRSVRLFAVVIACALAGCSTIANRASQKFADSLSNGILEQDDAAIARDGVPAWLLLTDGLIHGDPQNVGLLLAGARLYDSYASGFVTDVERSQRLEARSFDYARRATCVGLAALCAQIDQPFDAFQAELAKTSAKDVPVLYQLASSWAGRVQANSGDFKAIADVPKVQALLERVVALAPAHAGGEPYMYLGVLACLRPASLGGTPETGKADFEKALAMSNGKNQMVRVLYAQFYARLVFDKDLHDRLLTEALAADPHARGLTLVNTLAQQRAKLLLESGKDFF